MIDPLPVGGWIADLDPIELLDGLAQAHRLAATLEVVPSILESLIAALEAEAAYRISNPRYVEPRTMPLGDVDLATAGERVNRYA